MEVSLRVVFVAVVLLSAPIASQGQGQCDYPTNETVTDIFVQFVQSQASEGAMGQTVHITQIHFTCLARVALDKYTYASIVINFTVGNAPDDPRVRQFQLQCSSDSTWIRHPNNEFDNGISSISMPFEIPTETQCALCQQLNSNTANYDSVSNCLHCVPECLNNGGGFCTNPAGDMCCPSFDGDTGTCVDDCTTINLDFARNESTSVCVCNISCDPGYTRNTTDCSCVFTDGCEAAGQPCQNGGTCTSDLSTPPYYSCQCPPETTGQNCSIPYIECEDGCQVDQCNTTSGCCLNCTADYILDENNCHCAPVPTTLPPTRATTRPPCQPPCLDCEDDNPTCCTSCPDGYEPQPRNCECIELERTLATAQVAGLAFGLLLFILLVLSLVVLVGYVIYYVWANKQKMKKGTALSPFANGESHSNPLYLRPEEVDDD